MSLRGRRLGDYVLEERLGAGGMGEVYRARQLETGALRALKLISLDAGDDLVSRFEREAEALARVAHPRVVPVHGFFRAEGALALVLALCPGGDLEQRLQRGGPLPPDEAARLLLGLARGVAAAHALGVLHRDLKPANVLFGEDGGPRLSDFGLAKVVDRTSLTATGEVLGTPCYMAPEQALGEPVDERTDVYGLGGILYAALCARPPFEPGPPLLVLDQVVRLAPPAPSLRAPGVPAALDALCARALAKDPQQRPASAQELAELLEAHLAGRASGARRGRGAAALLVGLGAAALAWAGSLAGPPRPSPSSASAAPSRPRLSVRGSPRPRAPRSWRSGLAPFLARRWRPEPDPQASFGSEVLRDFVQAAPALAQGARSFEEARYLQRSDDWLRESGEGLTRGDPEAFLLRYLALAARGRRLGWQRLSNDFGRGGGGDFHHDSLLAERAGLLLIAERDLLGALGGAERYLRGEDTLHLAAACLVSLRPRDLSPTDRVAYQPMLQHLRQDRSLALPPLPFARSWLSDREVDLAGREFSAVRWGRLRELTQRSSGTSVRIRLKLVVLAELLSRDAFLRGLYDQVLLGQAREGSAPDERSTNAARGLSRGVLLLTRILRLSKPGEVGALAAWCHEQGEVVLARALAALSAWIVLGEGQVKILRSSAAGAELLAAPGWEARGAACDAALVAAGVFGPLPGSEQVRGPRHAPGQPSLPRPGSELTRLLDEVSLRRDGVRRALTRARKRAQARPGAPLERLLQRAAEAEGKERAALLYEGLVRGSWEALAELGEHLCERPALTQLGLCLVCEGLWASESLRSPEGVDAVQRGLLRQLRDLLQRFASRDAPLRRRSLAAIEGLLAREALPGELSDDWRVLWRTWQQLRRALFLPHQLGAGPHVGD